jgi:hypothetical protein
LKGLLDHHQAPGSLNADPFQVQGKRMEAGEGEAEDYRTRWVLGQVPEGNSRPGTEGQEEVAEGALEAPRGPSGEAGLADLAVAEGEQGLARPARPVS